MFKVVLSCLRYLQVVCAWIVILFASRFICDASFPRQLPAGRGAQP